MNVEAAASISPKAIIGHGDSFYWNGINSLEERDGRIQASFEAKYDGYSISKMFLG
ncbi:hypothetical protein PI124_g20893 [Phytophthora idaei]|nr:hypothetical protein PI125_g6084 [Phytophthora idaei]KAG3160456.1 hypothetical protein PI126_g6906 [Phytophthora idaei]KAG3234048.1 hypothetical protein PI124_g20893 [Phytophthora idaei]